MDAANCQLLSRRRRGIKSNSCHCNATFSSRCLDAVLIKCDCAIDHDFCPAQDENENKSGVPNLGR